MSLYNNEELDQQLRNLNYKGKFINNWFSNFVPSPMEIDGRTWNDVESYFASQKTLDFNEQEKIRLAPNAGVAKRLGRKVKLRSDWDNIKEDVMEKALRIKFKKGTSFYNKLKATGNSLIVEWNNWNDQYWGMTLDKKGKNRLGEILMKIRDEE